MAIPGVNPQFPVGANSQNENNLLKDWYTKDRIEDLVYPDTPFLMMLQKDMDISGRQYVEPQIYSDPQSTANTFSVALGNQYPLAAATFLLQPNQKYTTGSITGRVMRQSRDKEGAFLNLLKENIDKSIKNHMNRLHIDLCANNGTSALAEVAAVAASAFGTYVNVYEVQLSIPTQVRYFEVNARLTLADTQVPPFGVTAIGTLVAINRSSGRLILALDAPTAIPSSLKYIGYDGDYVTADASSGATSWQGLPAWLPSVAQRSVPGFLDIPYQGVQRSIDADRLSGVALDLPGSPVRSALIRLASAIRVNGGRPNVGLMHDFNYAQLEDSLGPNCRYETLQMGSKSNIGFRSIVLQTGYGEVRLVQDSAIPKNTMYLLDLDTWALKCWQDYANIVSDDSLTVIRVANDDSVTWRVRTFGTLSTKAVGFNGVVTI